MRDDAIVWVDLETTGSADDSEIIEIGSVITNTKDFSILSEFSQVIRCSAAGIERIRANPVVLNMHTKNGLLAELERGDGIPLWHADDLMSSWITGVVGASTEHIPLGGSGVSHFDRKFIRRDLPKVDKRLSYWAYDVGVLRRTWKLLGLPTLDDEGKDHRALADIILHVEEFKFYTNALSEYKAQFRPEVARQ